MKNHSPRYLAASVRGIILPWATSGAAVLLHPPAFARRPFRARALIDFETSPVEPTGPSLFGASTEQDVTLTGVATVSGGLILGNPTTFPAQSFSTVPNVYFTEGPSDSEGSSPTLLQTLTIAIDPSYTCNEVSFPVFNGNNVICRLHRHCV